MQQENQTPSPRRTSLPDFSARPRAHGRRRGGSLGSTLLAAALAASAVLVSACKDDSDKGTVLAQVGNSTLSLEELRESFPAEYEQLIRREQYLDFIKRWIDDEVLYQQALKARLDDDPQVRRKVDKLMRKLLIEEFLARESAAEAFEPDETAMNQYYEMHRDRFRRKASEVKYLHIRVETLKQAGDLRYRVGSDNAFLAQAATHSLDPVPEALAALPYKKAAELPPCLAEVASARIGQVTAPASCPDGFYLARIVDRQEAGSPIPFAEAKEEIAATLAMERKDKLLEARIAQYKEGTAISYNLDQIPGLAETAPAAARGPDSAASPTGAAASATAGSAVSAAPVLEQQPDLRPAAEPAPVKPVRRRVRPAAPPDSAAPQPTPTPEQPAAAPSQVADPATGAAPAQPQEASPDASNPPNPQ